MLRTLLLLSCTLLLSGCSNGIKLQLDAINTPGYPLQQQSYLLLSGDTNINSNDLYFQEFSRLTKHALEKAGLSPADTAESASTRVYLSFGVADGPTERYTYSTPIYDYVGGETITIKEKTTSNGLTTDTTTTEVSVPYSQRVVGRELRTQTIATYHSYLRLEGRDNNDEATQRWMVTVEIQGDVNDLRALIPIMLSRATPFIGKNSGKILHIRVGLDDAESRRFINEAND